MDYAIGRGLDLTALPLSKAELIEEASRIPNTSLSAKAKNIYDRYYEDKPFVDGLDRETRLHNLRKRIRKHIAEK